MSNTHDNVEGEASTFDDSSSSLRNNGDGLKGIPVADTENEMDDSLHDLNFSVRPDKATPNASMTNTKHKLLNGNSFTKRDMDTLDVGRGKSRKLSDIQMSFPGSDSSFSISNHFQSNHSRLGYDDDGVAVASQGESSQSERTTREDPLQKALIDAADQAFGIYATEAWVYAEDISSLVNVGNGLQVHRSPQLPPGPFDPKQAIEATDTLDQLIDASRADFIAPTTKSPGVGLPGVLWSEVGLMDQLTADDNLVIWRQVDAIASDPDQPHDDRLKLLSRAGFKLAAGIPFNIRGYKGMVIYYANPYADQDKLQNIHNERFMCSQTDLIGAILAVAKPAQDALTMRNQIRSNNWTKLRLRLFAAVRMGGSLPDPSKAAQSSRPSMERKRSVSGTFLETTARFWQQFKDEAQERKKLVQHKYAIWSHKCKGGNVRSAPPMAFQQALWTFVGVAIAHCVVSRLHEFIKDESKGQYTLVLAPIGSITALQYALTAAPSAQPRNIILGQTLAITIGLLLTYLPSEVDDWVRLSIAPAIAIPTMAFLGIPHPPAGATAIVFASGELDWIDLCIFIAALSFSIVLAVVINNLSDLRQYPTNWVLINSTKAYLIKTYYESKWEDKSMLGGDEYRNSNDDYIENEGSSPLARLSFIRKCWGGRRRSGNAAIATATATISNQDRMAASHIVVDKTRITGIRLKSTRSLDLVGDEQC